MGIRRSFCRDDREELDRVLANGDHKGGEGGRESGSKVSILDIWSGNYEILRKSHSKPLKA